jgi:hypothetical protein
MRAILSTLQYEGAETESITLLAALHNLLMRKAVALCCAVAASETAVETVALAEARKLNQATYIYAKSELRARSSDSMVTEKFKHIVVCGSTA